MNDNLEKNNRRYYQIAGITLQVNSEIPITDNTFCAKFRPFEIDGPGEDTITIDHHFSLPDLSGHNMGEKIYRREPWVVFKKGHSWIYMSVSQGKLEPVKRLCHRLWYRIRSLGDGFRPSIARMDSFRFQSEKGGYIHLLAVFNYDHTKVIIFNRSEDLFRRGNLTSLTLFPTDQILLARVLSERQGCYFHAGGVALGGEGILFTGHSGAGKSTIVTMLKNEAEILCDDRMIVREWPEGFRIHGNWSHGDVPDVSENSASLKAILFLKKAKENRLIPIANKQEVARRLLACLVRPLITPDWWDKMLALVERIAHEIPCYLLYFDRSGKVVQLLRNL